MLYFLGALMRRKQVYDEFKSFFVYDKKTYCIRCVLSLLYDEKVVERNTGLIAMLSNPKLIWLYTIYTNFYTKPHFYLHETDGNGVKRLNTSPFIGDKIYKMVLSREWTISSQQ